jgi:glycosyltransferase involved in cell wall biosynthesis
MGNMELSKDNVDNIIRAFALISDKHKDIDFYLYGAPSAKDKAFIENVIKECNMEERVFIKGRVPATEVPEILMKAHILVSSQPDTRRAEGGFPTKLGEYMATGIPTILTDVGEISQYVKDGVHVHIVPPEQPEPYAEKLDWMLNNYDKSLEIAQEADTIARRRYMTNVETFIIGKISTLDLNDAQVSKDQARRNHISELMYYWYYYYKIRSITLWDWERNTNIDADFEKIIRKK